MMRKLSAVKSLSMRGFDMTTYTELNQFDRAKAIAVLECMAIDLTGALAGIKETNPMADVLEQRIEAIDTAQAVLREQKNNWINVKDKRPKLRQRVLCVFDNQIYIATDWVDWPDGSFSFKVPSLGIWPKCTYWMPLPDLPKG